QQDIPRVFRSLKKNEERTRELLSWIQKAIISGVLRDPGKLGSTYLSTFLKKDEFIPESSKPLLPSSLRKLGAVFASVAHGPKNASKANTYASEALRHSSDNHASPSKRYTIVNMRKRGELYNQASPFYIFDEN
ncbi:4870_t:CDS:1, partial [Dentiscutata erythropus]